MIKKLMGLCLTACIVVTGLWGCSAPGTPEPGTSGENQARQEKDIPRGRYVESSIGIPLEDGEHVADVGQTWDKELELYTIRDKDKTAIRYVWTGDGWEKQEESMMEGLTFPYDSLHMIYGGDGNRYVLYQGGDDYKCNMARLSEGQAPQALLEHVFSVKNDRGYYDTQVDFGAVTEDGTILLSTGRETSAYSQTGEKLFSLPQESSASEWKTSGLLAGNQYITNGSKGFLEYDISSQSAAATTEYAYRSTDLSSMYVAMAPDGKGGFYTADPEGIHHMNQGGSLWETVADGTLNSLSLPSAYIRKLFVGNETDFYVWMSQSDLHEIKHYTYDRDMPSAPLETLTVYGLDLENMSTIRQAASMFQLKHPDVKVELIGGQEGGGNTTVSDTIRALNTELLGGNGADVLILDGLPVESYIEKGVLEDMRGILEPMISSGELMEQAAGPYTQADKSIYHIPSRMILFVAYGDQEAIGSLSSLEAMRNYQSDPSHLPLRPKCSYENLMRQVIALTYDEIVDSATGKLRPGKIQELIETVKILGDASGARVSFDESEDGGRGRVYNRVDSADGFPGSEFDRVDRNLSAAAVDKVRGMFDMPLLLAVQKKNGYRMEGVNASYLPNGTIGINQASPRKGLAEEFVLFVLGQEVQSSDLSDGLPVNTRAVDVWVDRGDKGGGLSVTLGDGSYSITGSSPTREECQMLFETAAMATHPIRTDRVLVEIIVDETMGFFDGTMPLEQAAANAQNKADLYFSE
ncbi:hypothetical protein DXC92_17840 [Clostridiales bacterium TF09-2AC]|nr:hypothetical protein DXC92_17840 [Clostridiales bacterium TF09-2AC]